MTYYMKTNHYPGTKAASQALILRVAAAVFAMLVVLGAVAFGAVRLGLLPDFLPKGFAAEPMPDFPAVDNAAEALAMMDIPDAPAADPALLAAAAPTPSPAALPAAASAPPRRVAFTFDDGPRREATPAMLDMLARKGVRGTFFVIGQHAQEDNADLLERIAGEGHLLANHTQDHVDLSKLSDEEVLSQIRPVNAMIRAAGGEPRYLRAPFGNVDQRLKALLAREGLESVLWDVDPRDWSLRDARAEVDLALSQVKDGSVILFHDIYPASVEATEMLIDELRGQGYEIVRLDELRGDAVGEGDEGP